MLGRASQAGDKRDPVTEARPKEERVAERRKRQRKRPRDPGGVHSRCRPQGVSSLLEPASISMVEGEQTSPACHRMGKSRKDGRFYLLKWPSARAMACQ